MQKTYVVQSKSKPRDIERTMLNVLGDMNASTYRPLYESNVRFCGGAR